MYCNLINHLYRILSIDKHKRRNRKFRNISHIYIYILEDEKIKNMILKERIFCIFTLQLKGSS